MSAYVVAQRSRLRTDFMYDGFQFACRVGYDTRKAWFKLADAVPVRNVSCRTSSLYASTLRFSFFVLRYLLQVILSQWVCVHDSSYTCRFGVYLIVHCCRDFELPCYQRVIPDISLEQLGSTWSPYSVCV